MVIELESRLYSLGSSTDWGHCVGLSGKTFNPHSPANCQSNNLTKYWGIICNVLQRHLYMATHPIRIHSPSFLPLELG